MNQAPSLRELDCRLAARLREFYKLTDTHQADSHADLPARCSFRHGLRRATFLREEGFGFSHKKRTFRVFAKGSFCLSGLVLFLLVGLDLFLLIGISPRNPARRQSAP